MRNEEFTTKNMLSKIRKCIDESNKPKLPPLNEEKKVLTESEDKGKGFKINKSTPQFGDVRTSQEETLKKTIGESLEMGEDGLVYYPENKDLVLTCKIESLKMAFQFRFNDPSGDGCYLWTNGLQLTETNNRTLGKVRDAFVNWKNSLIEDSDLLDRLHKSSTQK